MSFNYAGILRQVVAVWDDQHGSPVEADNPGVVFDFRAPWTQDLDLVTDLYLSHRSTSAIVRTILREVRRPDLADAIGCPAAGECRQTIAAIVSLIKGLTEEAPMQHTSLGDWNCSIARTLDVVGEWWTLLILRDAFRGAHRFDDFLDGLGLARSVLTTRLHKLTEHGVLERRAYSEHPPRQEYYLTEKGSALFPVIAALLEWGDTWAPTPAGPPAELVHSCGNVTRPVLTCPHCRAEVSAANTRTVPGPGSLSRESPGVTA